MSKLKNIRKENGLCTYCGKELDRKGYCCIKCNAMYNRWKMLTKNKLHEEDKCINCSKDMDRVGWFCVKCTSNIKMWGRMRCAYRRLNSLCVGCGIDVDSGSYCRKCLDRRMSYYYKKKERKL